MPDQPEGEGGDFIVAEQPREDQDEYPGENPLEVQQPEEEAGFAQGFAEVQHPTDN